MYLRHSACTTGCLKRAATLTVHCLPHLLQLMLLNLNLFRSHRHKSGKISVFHRPQSRELHNLPPPPVYTRICVTISSFTVEEEDSGKLRNYVHADPFSTLGSGYMRVQQGKHPRRLSSRHVAALLSTPILCDGHMIAYLPA